MTFTAPTPKHWTRRPLHPTVKALLPLLDDSLPKKAEGCVTDWGRSERDFVEIMARMFDAQVVE